MSKIAEAFSVSAPSVSQNSSVQLTLAEEDRWRELDQFGNELIVCKAGRKLVSLRLAFVVQGLDPSGHYTFSLSMKLVGFNRWKFSDGEWQSDGPSGACEASNVIMHHDHAQRGEYWMKNTVSFDRLKLTNRPQPDGGSEISLFPMHKYQPVVHVTRWYANEDGTNRSQLELVVEPRYTEFIAVTAYQNQQVIDVKIRCNPFAKGFLEGSAPERRASDISSEDTSGALNSNGSSSFITDSWGERDDNDTKGSESADAKWQSNLTTLRTFSSIIAVANLVAAILCLIFIELAFLCILGIVASLACLYAVFMRASLAYLPLIIQFVALTFLAVVSSSMCALMLAASQVPAVEKTIQYVLTVVVQTTLTFEHFQTYCSLFSAAFCGVALIFFAFVMAPYLAYRRQKESTTTA